MGVSLKSLDMLVKYLGTFLPRIHKQMIFFITRTIDEVNI
jgi:hypothetical protein